MGKSSCRTSHTKYLIDIVINLHHAKRKISGYLYYK